MAPPATPSVDGVRETGLLTMVFPGLPTLIFLDSCLTSGGREWGVGLPADFRRKVLDLIEAGRSVAGG